MCLHAIVDEAKFELIIASFIETESEYNLR